MSNYDNIYDAICDQPGISGEELRLQLKLPRLPVDTMQTLIANARILPLDGKYYPYSEEYMPLQNRNVPPLKVWHDSSVVGSMPEFDLPDVQEVMEGAVVTLSEGCVFGPLPEISEETIGEIKHCLMDEPTETPGRQTAGMIQHNADKQAAALARAESALAELLKRNVPFTGEDFYKISGLSRSYLSSNPAFKQRFNQAKADHKIRTAAAMLEPKDWLQRKRDEIAGEIARLNDHSAVLHGQLRALETVVEMWETS